MATLKLIDNIVSSIDSNLNQTSIDSTSKKDNIPLSKHFIQSEKTTVLDSIDAAIYDNPHITRLSEVDSSIKVVVRKDWKSNYKTLGDEQVAVIAGGGSGHYPCFWGFVGKGMVSAAVNGEIVCILSSQTYYQKKQNLSI